MAEINSQKSVLHTCKNGHSFSRAGNCTVCPICDKAASKSEKIWTNLSAPARRALHANGIDTVEKISTITKRELVSWHGIGPSALRLIEQQMASCGVGFAEIPD